MTHDESRFADIVMGILTVLLLAGCIAITVLSGFGSDLIAPK